MRSEIDDEVDESHSYRLNPAQGSRDHILRNRDQHDNRFTVKATWKVPWKIFRPIETKTSTNGFQITKNLVKHLGGKIFRNLYTQSNCLAKILTVNGIKAK